MKKLKKSLALFLLLVVAVISSIITLRWMAQPPGASGEALVLIAPGQNLKRIAESLEKAGVIRNSLYFVWFARFKGGAKSIRAGEYLIPKNRTPQEVLNQLVHGQVLKRQFTVPEGKTLVEIAAIVGKTNVLTGQAFLEAASNTSGMEPWLKPGASNLEGVLFPDTYAYTRNTAAGELVKMMTVKFRKVFEPLWKDRDPASTLQPYEAVILASIVERETGRADERLLIAAVFINLLNHNMRLESDPTVIYGIPNFSGNLTTADLKRPTPYNTYTQAGLPAGPICNPGADSLRAVLHPPQSNLLYFVAKGDGSHQFSATLEEHNAAVRTYQKGSR